MMAIDAEKERPKQVAHDEAPSNIVDHPFEPKAAWWSLCGYTKENGALCNLAESAHAETSIRFRYYGDDVPDE